MTQAIGNADLATALRIDAAQVRAARLQAHQAGRPTLEVLEEQLHLPPAEFIARLAQTFRYSAFTMADFDALTPAFDVLPFAGCQARECAVLRGPDGELHVALADPFAVETRAWVEEYLGTA